MGLVGQLRFEPVTRRVRASLGGQPVLDTTDAVLVWEPRRVVPMYAVPPADLSASLVPSAAAEVPERLPPVLGPVHFEWHHTPGQSFDVVVGDRPFPAAGFAPNDPDLGGRVIIDATGELLVTAGVRLLGAGLGGGLGLLRVGGEAGLVAGS